MLTAEGSRPPGPGWSTITSIVDNTVPRFTTTFDVWTSFSKANVSFLVGVPTARGKLTTMTPVYALGSPVKSESLVTYPDINITFTTVTGATPDCNFTDVATAVVQTDCGRCTLNGGTVELYYWLDQATHLNDPPINTESMSSPLRSTVLNGTTLYSPSVYISFQTAFATNSCRRVGQAHTGTMLALRPEDVSTQVHVGGPVYQSGANRYGAMNYADLTGLPPAKVYESQPSCIMFGCATIYPSSYFPTLVIPPQMRALDSAWRDCDVGLDGLYDPPVALTPQTVMATPTLPSAIVISATAAAPQSTPIVHAPDTTQLDLPTNSVSKTSSADDSTSTTSSMAEEPINAPQSFTSYTIAESVSAMSTKSLPLSASAYPAADSIAGTIISLLSSSAPPQLDPMTSATSGATSLPALRPSIVDDGSTSSAAAPGEVSSRTRGLGSWDPAATVTPPMLHSTEPPTVATGLGLLSVVMSAVHISITEVVGTPSSSDPEASLDALVPDAVEPVTPAVVLVLTITATISTPTRTAADPSFPPDGGIGIAAGGDATSLSSAMSLTAAETPFPATPSASARCTGPIDPDGGLSGCSYTGNPTRSTQDPSSSITRGSSAAETSMTSVILPIVTSESTIAESSNETSNSVQLPVVTTAESPTSLTDGMLTGSRGSPSSARSTSGCACNDGVWAATKAEMILTAYATLLLLPIVMRT
ncbi:hypothetical protein LTR12_017696 [Friedmanniomyces endolithicus]|nr:hypothetical protein LTR12_017696 [Friedmanniomyces endolithicus]